jgi:AhpD family alkylhydroperoxidase
MWGMTSWFMTDTKLSAKEKALVALGAATANHCPYWVPFHAEQLRLAGMGDAELEEAALCVLQSTGSSSYLHGISYPVEKFKHELDSTVKYIKSHSKVPEIARK